LEAGFTGWDWLRAHDGAGGCIVQYHGAPRAGPALDLSLRLGADGAVSPFPSPPDQKLPMSLWGIERRTRTDAAALTRTLEDAPFYARSELLVEMAGHRGPAMHESLNLNRFAAPWVRALLPVRMPRRA
jgi:carotenoid 1,2-hydratase